MSVEITKEDEQQKKHSGGVKTNEGKAVSRYNAQRHGILRETVTEYEKVDAAAFFNDLAEDLEPRGRVQELLVESIASNAVRLQRISKAEAELMKEALSPEILSLSMRDREYKPKVSMEVASNLSLYSRYQTATENRIYRALVLLKQLKTYEQS